MESQSDENKIISREYHSFQNLINMLDAYTEDLIDLSSSFIVSLRSSKIKDSVGEKKFNKWYSSLGEIVDGYFQFQETGKLAIEKSMSFNFCHSDILFPLFLRLNIKNIFNEIRDSVNNGEIDGDELPRLKQLIEFGTIIEQHRKGLALIGDGALDLALFNDHSSRIVEIRSWASDLDKLRQKNLKNEKLAKIYDSLGLDDLVVPKKTDKDNQDITGHDQKGTIIEAIFGLMYLESDLDTVTSNAVKMLT
jgi:hypothetical protein